MLCTNFPPPKVKRDPPQLHFWEAKQESSKLGGNWGRVEEIISKIKQLNKYVLMPSSGCESLVNSWNYLFSPTDGGSLESIPSLSSLKSRRILTCRVPTLKSRWFPSCQLPVIPRKNNNKGTKSSFCELPRSCSSLQSSTFGLSSAVPLINHRGGAGRGQLWLPHPPLQPSPPGSSASPWGDTAGARQLCHHQLTSASSGLNYN